MADCKRKTANLLDNVLVSTTYDGVTVTLNPDKSITVNGTLETTSQALFKIGTVLFENGESYTISGVTGYTSITMQMFTESNTAFPRGNRLQCFDGAITRTALGDETCDVNLYVYVGAVFDNVKIYPFICKGSTPLPYEPYGWVHSLRKLTTATDTLTTLPADIYADGTNATVGLKGNTVQNGTPTPDNPIMPNGTGERTNNLCDESTIQRGFYGTSESYSVFTAGNRYRCFKLDLPAGTYTLNIAADEDMYILRCSNSVDGAITVNSAPPYTFTLSADAAIYVSWRNVDTINSFTNMKVMLNEGSTALPYEPYGYKIPISSAGQTTPVYLGEVESTRRIKKLVFTGGVDENWEEQYVGENRHLFRINTNLGIIKTNEEKCTHFIYGATTSSTTTVTFDITSVGVLRFRPDNAVSVSLSDWTTWLQQQNTNRNPLTVWIVLANEETAVVNEPLMKIGDYADIVSGITVPTITGKDTFDVETTLKPSESSLSYTGWHDASVEEWDGSQWNE